MENRISKLYTWLVYVILWGMAWTYPVLVEVTTTLQENTLFSWTDILRAWKGIAPFFLLFLFHQLPMYRLLLRHRIRAYCVSAFFLLFIFAGCRYWSMKDFPRHHPEQELFLLSGKQPPERKPIDRRPPQPERHRPAFFGIPGLLSIDLVIAMLMLGFDLAIVLLSRYQEEEEKKRRLDAAHKEHELEHLKAQLNPHFFMNMLNNIHGMVDIDSKLAQEMIMELSKLMRYVLYEGTKSHTTLQQEKAFISNYVELMRKRCSDTKVCIGVYLPQEPLEHILIPPLLFISIIENAFKHGISYRNASFVDIRLSLHEKDVTLECMNSVHALPPRQSETSGGIGLNNLRQRLQLLYGNAFTLEIEHTESIYHVNLTIPCEYETDQMPCH